MIRCRSDRKFLYDSLDIQTPAEVWYLDPENMLKTPNLKGYLDGFEMMTPKISPEQLFKRLFGTISKKVELQKG